MPPRVRIFARYVGSSWNSLNELGTQLNAETGSFDCPLSLNTHLLLLPVYVLGPWLSGKYAGWKERFEHMGIRLAATGQSFIRLSTCIHLTVKTYHLRLAVRKVDPQQFELSWREVCTATGQGARD